MKLIRSKKTICSIKTHTHKSNTFIINKQKTHLNRLI